jgi:membrane protein DedA with SNARE-associated domain
MTAFILQAIARGGYFGIFLLMAAENIVPPIPSEVIMGLGGMAVSRGHFAFWPLLAVGTAGTVAGNLWWYWLGRRFGYHGLRPVVDRWGRWLTMDWQDVERIRDFFIRRGQWVVFVFRFMPAFRTIVSLPAGMAGMGLLRFLVATAAGSAIWNAILIWAGLALDSHFRELDRYVGPASIALFVAMGAFYLYRVVTWRPRA